MQSKSHPKRRSTGPALTTELLILPDGQVLVHNLTAAFADLLRELNPGDAPMGLRASAVAHPGHHDSRTRS